MKILLRLCLFCILVSPAFAAGWKLVWSDEFDKAGAPNPAKWNYETGFIRNHEEQFYTRAPKNARVENGMLIIEARKEKFKNPEFNPKASTNDWQRSREFAKYTSATLTTQGKASWTYGRIEVRAKLPAGRGVWPAIWTLGTNISQVGWPACGEIDIMEMVGYEPEKIYAHAHVAKAGFPNKKISTGKGTDVPDCSSAFHVYAVEWDADHMDFFVDDKKYFSYEKGKTSVATWPFDQPQYLILNLAIGGAWGGQKGIDDTIFPQRFYIDYVRVYQKQP